MTDWNQTPPSSNPSAQPTLEQRLRDTAATVEAELHRLIGYVNDHVVPEVRRNGSTALKRAAEELNRLAGQMDSADRAQPNPPTTPPPGPQR